MAFSVHSVVFLDNSEWKWIPTCSSRVDVWNFARMSSTKSVKTDSDPRSFFWNPHDIVPMVVNKQLVYEFIPVWARWLYTNLVIFDQKENKNFIRCKYYKKGDKGINKFIICEI